MPASTPTTLYWLPFSDSESAVDSLGASGHHPSLRALRLMGGHVNHCRPLNSRAYATFSHRRNRVGRTNCPSFGRPRVDERYTRAQPESASAALRTIMVLSCASLFIKRRSYHGYQHSFIVHSPGYLGVTRRRAITTPNLFALNAESFLYLSMKESEIHNRESYYHANQATAEDVANIVTGDTRSGAYSAYLIRAGSAIGVFVLRRTLIRHDLLVCGILVSRNALSKSTLRFVQADSALR
jgi:hypothetical protein